jgi:hypothetical protein
MMALPVIGSEVMLEIAGRTNVVAWLAPESRTD